MSGLVGFLLIGLVAGWLAGQLMKGKGFGLLGNILVGIIGAFLGGFLFRAPGDVRRRDDGLRWSPRRWAPWCSCSWGSRLRKS